MKLLISQRTLSKIWSPSMRREWIEIDWRMVLPEETGSPSMRREWIEMQVVKSSWLSRIVSLHAEGVD